LQSTPRNFGTRLLGPLACVLGAYCLWVWASRNGPVAVSDDDFARVVIAQRFALRPSWDPSGTSWLPFPFYWDGLWLHWTDGSLAAARIAAGFRSIVASLCLYSAGRVWGVRPSLSALGAWLPFLLPTLRILTVATVPEYLTGALSWLAVSLLVGPEGSLLKRTPVGDQSHTARTVLGLAALLVATLSRYEPWSLALALGAYGVLRQRRIWPLLTLLGPAIWMLHGMGQHGSPFFFAARVANYKAALGAPSEAWWQAFATYPRQIFELEPLLMMMSLGAGFCLLRVTRLRTWLAAFSMVGLNVFFLSLASVFDGAPTHHPERAVTLVWLAAPILPGLLLSRVLDGSLKTKATEDLSTIRTWASHGAVFLGLLALGLVLTFMRPQPNYSSRAVEIAVGKALREVQAEPFPTLLGTTDYGYFAIMASAGAPARFVIAQDHDPRKKAEGEHLASLIRSIAKQGQLRWMVIPICFDFIVDELEASFEIRAESADFLVLGPPRTPRS
jgi:hypothetical protein